MSEEERLYGTVNYANALYLTLSSAEILGLEDDMLNLLVQIRGGRYE